jgi:histidinol dehydrogenase
MKWRVINYQQPSARAAAEEVLMRRLAVPNSIGEQVARILSEVRQGGDRAVMALTQRFDGVRYPRAAAMRVDCCARFSSPELERAARYALKNIQRFSKAHCPRSWTTLNQEGARVGETYHPLARVGIYVPGGTAPLISSALMTVGIAKAAGVAEIVVTTPPPIAPDLQAALMLAGATEVYGIGGAQAIAAMAFGTKTVRPVLKICGPGNAYVVEAKRQVMGWVAVDQLPGPSEIAVLADETANVEWVAADVLAQGEHGHGSQVLVVGVGQDFFNRLFGALERQLKGLKRQDFLLETLKQGSVFVCVSSVEEGARLVERYAPEHLSLQVRGAASWAKKIRHCGAIFIGGFSPVAAGDYVAGPSHTLPTGGAAKQFAGLTVMDFMRRTSVVAYDRRSIRKAAKMIETLALAEGLDGHAASVKARLEIRKIKR